MENYYDILGVSQTATQDEIKKAFRTKSKTMHPDKGGNEDDFKRINEAYDTLGNEEKRAQYDQRGNNPFGGFGGGDPFDIFSQMFGGFNQQTNRKAPDKIVDLNVGVVDSFLGKQIDVNFSRKTACTPCNGTGGEKETCNVCKGQGSITQRVGNSFFSNIIKTPCGKCQGRGHTFKTMCQSCHGEGKQNEFMNLKINLPKGASDGQYIKAQNYGDFHNGMFGDVIFKINVIPQGGFEKSGGDLIYNYVLTLDDLNKDNISIPYPTGELLIQLPKEIDTSKPLRVKNKGFENEGGDLYINLNFKHTRL